MAMAQKAQLSRPARPLLLPFIAGKSKSLSSKRLKDLDKSHFEHCTVLNFIVLLSAGRGESSSSCIRVSYIKVSSQDKNDNAVVQEKVAMTKKTSHHLSSFYPEDVK